MSSNKEGRTVIGANGLVWQAEHSPGNGADGKGELSGGGRLPAPRGGGLHPGEPQFHMVRLSKTRNSQYLPAAWSLAGTNRAVARMGYDLTSLYPTEELSGKVHAQI